MSQAGNPTEIAREAFRQLATRRIPPTPDNYRLVYAEVSGQPAVGHDFPEKPLKNLANELTKRHPEHPRLGRDLDEAIKGSDWEKLTLVLGDYASSLTEVQRLSWAELIGNLFRLWEQKTANLTQGKKRESLEHVLESASSNPKLLFSRLDNLLRSWAQGSTGMESALPLTDEPNANGEVAQPAHLQSPDQLHPSSAGDLLPEFRELFAYTLEHCIAPLLADQPKLAEEAVSVANSIRQARAIKQLQAIQGNLKRFAFRLELQTEDQAELRGSLVKLLRLVVQNISELVLDDQWIHGQVEIIRQIVDKPLSQQAIDDAEQRLKEVIFKQGQLKLSLQEAKDALKNMLAGFVDHLADFAGATSDYHAKIEQCAAKIGAANGINELESVLQEVMQETRNIQINALRSHDELVDTQARVKEAETRILSLEKELSETSHLIRHDQLTGVLNRRGLEESFDKEIARSLRHETPLCLSMLDIDNFKRINDTLGHDVGDAALIHLATVIRETLRPQDTVARFGGEEFVIIMPETSLDQACVAMTRVQRELTRRIFLNNNDKLLITFSAGVTEMHPNDDHAAMLKRADEAMYQAKQTGKNKVITSP